MLSRYPIFKFLQEKKQLLNIGMLIFLILIWGLNWPMLKLSLNDASPLWLAVMRLLIASLFVFAYLLITKKLKFPSKADLPMLISISLFQMTAFMAFTNIGLSHVSVGRSAILAYSTTLWVTPVAVFLFKETLPPLKLLGLVLGLLGVLLLFSPWGLNWKDHTLVWGNLFLVFSAISWSIAMLHTRVARWHLTPLQLLPWQMSIAGFLLALLAKHFEPHPTFHWDSQFFWLLLYIGPLATGLGYWIMNELGRRLSSVTTSLCLLAVPVWGLASAHMVLGEHIYVYMMISMGLILLGLAFVVQSNKRQLSDHTPSAKNP